MEKTLGQYIIDKFDEEFLNKIWSDKNELTPFDYAPWSGHYAWFKCPNGIHEDVNSKIGHATKRNYNCRKCSIIEQHNNQRKNLVGEKFGKWTVVELDREKSTETGLTYWFCDCDCGNKHISVTAESLLKGTSNSCGCRRRENSGEKHHNWKGGITPESIRVRNSKEYKEWREKVFEKDNYTCQCCGKHGGKLNAHHIRSFSSYKNLRFDVKNGITLCDEHHSFRYIGSLHNLYGAKDVTPKQLKEYINNKRKEFGIDIKFTFKDYKSDKCTLK